MADDRRRPAALHSAGLLFILAAAATIAAVVGRVSAGADQDTVAASLAAIAASQGRYAAGGAARLVSGMALAAAAWCLHRAPAERRPHGTALVASLLAASGMLTACSGAGAVVLAAGVPAGLDAAGLDALARELESTAWLRRATGAAGFALAGMALIAAARSQWGAGGMLRRIAPASAVLGLAMQLVWLDAATWVHPITGTAFVVWLAAAAGSLLKGRTWWGAGSPQAAAGGSGRSPV